MSGKSSLARARNISDLRLLARRRLPKMVFDYIDGGAENEITLANNTSRLEAYSLMWSALVDVEHLHTGTTILGAPSPLPFFISPSATSRLFHTKGERAVAAAADAAGIPYSLSTLASTTLEDVARTCAGTKFFQIYMWRDRNLVQEVMERARAAGFVGLILTVDTVVAGNRERDKANDFTIPPKVTLRTAGQALRAPRYLWDMFASAPIRPENFTHLDLPIGELASFFNAQFDRSVTWADVAWLAAQWGGPIAVKGICTPDDARRAIDHGATAVWLSNHGGRQLDTAPATIDMLEGVADAVAGRSEVIFDSGVRRGVDIIKALALGATSVAIGRAYLYGLGAGGEAGVVRAIEILIEELHRDMRLAGIPDLTQIDRGLIVRP